MAALPLELNMKSTISLESQMQRLALEANFIANVLDTFKNVVPNLLNTLSNSYNNLKTSLDTEEAIIKDLSISLKFKLKQASFSNYDKTLVSIPEGFKGNFLEYVQLLNELSPEVHKEANKILGEYNFALSTFLTNKESKTALKDYTDLFERVSRRREEMIKKLEDFHKGNASTSKAYLKQVMHRFSDMDTLIKSMQQLNKNQQKSSLREITSSVNESVRLLDLVVKQVESQDMDKVSGNAAMNISQGAYELGKYVEFISIYRYRVEQMNSCCNKLVEKLENIL